eukprot:110847-Pleurochrysis_carterae.AAC.1
MHALLCDRRNLPPQLQAIATDLLADRVPSMWDRDLACTLTRFDNLQRAVSHLRLRHRFFEAWLHSMRAPSRWPLGAFARPHSFLNAAVLDFAARNKLVTHACELRFGAIVDDEMHGDVHLEASVCEIADIEDGAGSISHHSPTVDKGAQTFSHRLLKRAATYHSGKEHHGKDHHGKEHHSKEHSGKGASKHAGGRHRHAEELPWLHALGAASERLLITGLTL